MKIVACIPFRNESLLLPTCLASLQGVADELLGFDDGSTDESRKIFEGCGGIVRSSMSPHSSWVQGREATVRASLLSWGRQRGATHFIWLDADEALTANFMPIARERIAALPIGHKLILQWLACWKSPSVYRDDESVWSNNYKDFIVHDDPSFLPHEGVIHFGRTQGQNTATNSHKVALHEGAVLHFQFAAWRQFQAKQCWYRCAEFLRSPGMVNDINSMYSITLEDNFARCSSVLGEWVEGFPLPIGMEDQPPRVATK